MMTPIVHYTCANRPVKSYSLPKCKLSIASSFRKSDERFSFNDTIIDSLIFFIFNDISDFQMLSYVKFLKRIGLYQLNFAKYQ